MMKVEIARAVNSGSTFGSIAPSLLRGGDDRTQRANRLFVIFGKQLAHVAVAARRGMDLERELWRMSPLRHEMLGFGSNVTSSLESLYLKRGKNAAA